MLSRLPRALVSGGASIVLVCAATPAAAQSGSAPPCGVLCAPTVTLMPTLNRSHLFGGPAVRSLPNGAPHRLASTSNMEIIVVTAAKTRLPRLSVFGSVQWLPNASESRNPFTLYTASELGGTVHANAPTATLGLSGMAVKATDTHGWADLAANLGSLFSQAAQPNDRSAYTAKLDLELITHLHLLNWTPPKTYVHRISLFGILDYVATGLPHAGDQVPQGRLYLTDARPTTLLIGLALPLTPEAK